MRTREYERYALRKKHIFSCFIEVQQIYWSLYFLQAPIPKHNEFMKVEEKLLKSIAFCFNIWYQVSIFK